MIDYSINLYTFLNLCRFCVLYLSFGCHGNGVVKSCMSTLCSDERRVLVACCNVRERVDAMCYLVRYNIDEFVVVLDGSDFESNHYAEYIKIFEILHRSARSIKFEICYRFNQSYYNRFISCARYLLIKTSTTNCCKYIYK